LVHGPPETVLALAGGDVTLPCSFSIKASDDFPTVEWSKEGLKPNVVFLYRNGGETPEMKNPAFRYRTSLIVKELNNGNISLRISNVQLSDAGRYQCMRWWRTAPRDITPVELVVGAVSEPKLSVRRAEGGGVTLECCAHCWLPEPRVSFLDEQGNDIGGDEPKRDREAGGCFTVRRRATLRNAAERVTCRVHQGDINQTRDVEILLPVVRKKSCILTAGFAVGIVLLLVAACWLTFFLWKRFGKSAEEPSTPSSSNQSTAGGSSEGRLLLEGVRVAGENKSTIVVEMLATQVEDLKLKLGQKEDAILRLQMDHKARLAACVTQDDESVSLPAAATRTPGYIPPSRRRGFSRQSSHPVRAPPVDRADRTNRRHSMPAPLDLAPLDLAWSPGSHVDRSMSDPRAFGPGQSAKLPRSRSSSGFPSNQHYTLLGNVAEDSEMLIA